MSKPYDPMQIPELREPAAIDWVPDENMDPSATLGLMGIEIRGVCVGWMVRRPAYCDRGHWQVGSSLPGIDAADGFPRYYMSRDVAIAETEAFLKWRLWRE